MIRTINTDHPATARAVTPDLKKCLPQWLTEQAAALGPAWLLAHADDGVIWGRWMPDGGLVTSHDAALGHPLASKVCPSLRWLTLQQARLFTAGAELLVWRDGEGKYTARLIADSPDGAAWSESFDEAVRLLGTDATPLPHDFTLLEDGAQGLHHAVPMSGLPCEIPPDSPPCLLYRHYLAREPLARVAVSRLCGLTWKGAAIVPA